MSRAILNRVQPVGITMGRAQLTLIVTTIRRPETAKRFLNSVRRYCPAMQIILSEQANEHQLSEFCAGEGIEHLPLQFDHGISGARNLMVQRVNTDYFVLADDDYLLRYTPDFDLCSRFLDANPDFLCVLGRLDDYHAGPGGYVYEYRNRIKNLCLDETGHGLIFIPLTRIAPTDIVFEGERLMCCDFGPNWGVFRRSFFVENGFGWDEQFKIGGEHFDFFLQLKSHHPGARIAYWSKLAVDHIPTIEDGYVELRRREGWRAAFREKWKLRYRCDLGYRRVFDDW